MEVNKMAMAIVVLHFSLVAVLIGWMMDLDESK